LAGASDIAAVVRFMASQAYVSKGKWLSVAGRLICASRAG
jgi:hypothetical protein